MPHHYVLRRLASGGFRPRRDGALALGGTGLLLAALVLGRQQQPGSPALGLTWSAPELVAARPFTLTHSTGSIVALTGLAGTSLATRQRSFFGDYVVYSGPHAQPARAVLVGAPPRVSPAGAAAWGVLKKTLWGYWHVIKLGFRQPLAQ